MGIPGFFNNCIVKFNVPNDPRVIRTDLKSMENIHLNNDNNDNNNNSSNSNSKTKLFLDFNCAIYYVLKPEFKTDETLIIHTIEYLDSLVKIFDNLDLLYIAIDGVPPRAKMEQQRSRRFHSVCKKKKANEINEKYGNELDKTVYNTHIDTNMITPGTEFMSKLTKAIRKHLSTSELYNNKKVIFSDSSIPGEGEHKILSYIKTNTFIDNDEIVIYGLDGDLIMLSMIANRKNMYLLREAVQYGGFSKYYNGHKYLFFDIDNLKDAIIDSFNSHCDELPLNKREIYE